MFTLGEIEFKGGMEEAVNVCTTVGTPFRTLTYAVTKVVSALILLKARIAVFILIIFIYECAVLGLVIIFPDLGERKCSRFRERNCTVYVKNTLDSSNIIYDRIILDLNSVHTSLTLGNCNLPGNLSVVGGVK